MSTSRSLTDIQILAVCKRITYCEAKVARYIHLQDVIMAYHIAKVFAGDVYLDANELSLESETNMLHHLRSQVVPAPRSLVLAMENKIARIITRGDSLRAEIKMEERDNWREYWKLEAEVMAWVERLMEAREIRFEAKLKAIEMVGRRRRCIIC